MFKTILSLAMIALVSQADATKLNLLNKVEASNTFNASVDLKNYKGKANGEGKKEGKPKFNGKGKAKGKGKGKKEKNFWENQLRHQLRQLW